MNMKQKLTYMLIGCLFTMSGYVLSIIINPLTQGEAQDEKIAVFDKITCKKLEIVNDYGKTAAELSSSPGGYGLLKTYNNEGKLSTKLDIWGMVVFNDEGQSVAALGEAFDGGGFLRIDNHEGGSLAKLDSFLGVGGLTIYNDEGESVATLGQSLSGGGVLQFYNKEGKQLVVISSLEGRPNDGLINIYNHRGEWRSFSAEGVSRME
ncbi:hypothetical protein F4X73_04540 [Candidatus Poribacteria bacterium]|nr:hypothetical protein [Candidatus Poribacteria bacterium]